MRILILSAAFVLAIVSVATAQTCRTIGSSTFCDNGLSANRIGNSTFWNDGVSSNRIGNSTFNSDGTSSNRIGNSTFYNDGTSSNTIGDTTFFSNGRSCTRIGNSIHCNCHVFQVSKSEGHGGLHARYRCDGFRGVCRWRIAAIFPCAR